MIGVNTFLRDTNTESLMKIVAHYKNEQLQTKGWKALAKYRPRRMFQDGMPVLSIELTTSTKDLANSIVKELKKESTPFLIAKVNEDIHKDAGKETDERMSVN